MCENSATLNTITSVPVKRFSYFSTIRVDSFVFIQLNIFQKTIISKEIIKSIIFYIKIHFAVCCLAIVKLKGRANHTTVIGDAQNGFTCYTVACCRVLSCGL